MDEPMQCPICKDLFKNLLDYAFHSKNHESNGFYSCHVCTKKVTHKKQFERHILSHKRFKCEVCNRIFKRKFTALNHAHSWEKLFQCKICGKHLSTAWALNNHLGIVHGENITEGPLLKHQCRICLKSYLYESGLKLHYSSQHKELGKKYNI